MASGMRIRFGAGRVDPAGSSEQRLQNRTAESAMGNPAAFAEAALALFALTPQRVESSSQAHCNHR